MAHVTARHTSKVFVNYTAKYFFSYCLRDRLVLKATGPASFIGQNFTPFFNFALFCFPEPGEFQFEQPHYYADLKASLVTVKVVRQKGCDGNVSVEYSTM